VSTDASARPGNLQGVAVTVALVGKAAEWLTLAALLTLVPRLLGPADYGSFALALGLVTLGSASFALGGAAVMSRFVPAATESERIGLARALAIRAIRWRMLGMASMAAVATALMLIAPDDFPPVQTLIVLAAIALDTAATLAFQIALGLDRPVLWSFRYPVQNLVLVAAVIPLHAIAGTTGALAAIALSSGVALVLGSWLIRAHVRGAPAGPVPAAVSRFALLQGLNGVLVQVMHRGGVVVVALLAGSRVETGYAALATGVGIAVTYAVWQMFTVALPRLSALAATDGHAVGLVLDRLTGRTVLVLAPASIAGAVLAGPLLRLFADGQFAPADSALSFALATAPLAPLTGAVAAAASVRLQPGARLCSTAMGAAVFLVSALALAPSLGAEGATIALLAGTIVAALVGTTLFPDLLDKRLVAAALATTVVVLAIGVAQ
jgi:O-antigen/teichoic acid export membrane protein